MTFRHSHFLLLGMMLFTGPLFGDEIRASLLSHSPDIDGRINEVEWAEATGFDGFIEIHSKQLELRRCKAWVGADAEAIYLALRSQLPDEGELLTAVTNDSLKVVYDDSLEIYVNPTPTAPDRVDYQAVFNALGKGSYNIHKVGHPKEEIGWRGNWTIATSQHNGWWDFEAAIPIASMQGDTSRKITDGTWGINLTRNWKPDWGWSSLSGGYAHSSLPFVFTEAAAPVVQYSCDSVPSFSPALHRLRVSNLQSSPMSLLARMQIGRNTMPMLKQEATLDLAPGESKTFEIQTPENDPTKYYALDLRVSSADDKTVFFQRTTQYTRVSEAPRWIATRVKKTQPLDFSYAVYPSKNSVRMSVDINGLPKAAKVDAVTAFVRQKGGKTLLAQTQLLPAGFKDGKQAVHLTVELSGGEYEIGVTAAGQNVPEGEVVKTFERRVFPWEHNRAGTSTTVYAPFTPLQFDGQRLSSVLRVHDLNGFGVWDQVTATSANTGIARPIQAAPMQYVARVGGKEVFFAAEKIQVTSNAAHQIELAGAFAAQSLKAQWVSRWDYDGCVKVALTLLPTDGQIVDSLDLEIPFTPESGALVHANSDRIRSPIAQKVPAGNGVVWDSSKLACDDYLRNFCPYIYLGSAVRGLCWFAENDLGWSWDPTTPNLDIVRRDNQVVLRIHLINKPTAITLPQTLTFGLLAAPVKPMLTAPGKNRHWSRYRYWRDNYSLLGTDINWLALGDCGSVYPAGKDMTLWEALASGNQKRPTNDEVEALIAHGRTYYEPYGEEAVKTFVNHARANMNNHLGQNMVFYYNRASCQLFPEFQTFKDEWCLDDFRSVGPGNGRGEIKIVPSQSYIDHALYWYAKSFEIGRNRGVYWDNWFIAPTFNTAMSDAYRRADGTLVPASGIWALRELCKRTFVMMNERKMLPITFPHMTSFSPLPMLSFATVQYDWEWKYSEGDVQDRFTREGLLLCSTGELAGVWPVPLSDHGTLSEDPWTQRTFTAVRILHELDGYGGCGFSWSRVHQVNQKELLDPIVKLLDDPTLSVYKYWEDRSQPASTGEVDLPVIVYSVPGKEAIIAIVSYARTLRSVTLRVDLEAMAMSPGCRVVDVSTGNAVAMENGGINLSLKAHDIRVIRLEQP